jgi:hypothetical protein
MSTEKEILKAIEDAQVTGDYTYARKLMGKCSECGTQLGSLHEWEHKICSDCELVDWEEDWA